MADVSTIVIKGETSGVRQATADLDKFERATKEVTAATDRLGRESDETSKVVNRTSQATTQATARTRGLAEAKTQAANAAQNYASRLGPIGGILSAIGPAGLAAAAAIGGISVAMSKSIAVANEFDRLNNTLLVATGSAQGAQSAFDFLAETSSRLGLDLKSAGLQFAQLAAAAKGTALEGQGARDVFEAVAVASTALQLSSSQTEGALNALQQMISKGTVQAEELRGQLGERVPGAFQIAARAMGVTTQELGKMLELGQVTADDLLPKLAAELENTFGAGAERAAGEYAATVNRLSTAMDRLLNEIGQGAQDNVTPVLQTITDALVFLRKEIAGTKDDLREGPTVENIEMTGAVRGFNVLALQGFAEVGEAIAVVSGALASDLVGSTVDTRGALDALGERFRSLAGHDAFMAEVALKDAALAAENAARAKEEAERAAAELATELGVLGVSSQNAAAAVNELDAYLGLLSRTGMSDGADAAIDFAAGLDMSTLAIEQARVASADYEDAVRGVKGGLDESTASAIEYWASLDRVEQGTTASDAATQALEAQLAALRDNGVEGYEALIAEQERSARVTELAAKLVEELGIAEAEARIIAEGRVGTAAEVAAEYQRQKDALDEQREAMERQVTLADILKGAAEEAGRAIQRSLGDAFRDVSMATSKAQRLLRQRRGHRQECRSGDLRAVRDTEYSELRNRRRGHQCWASNPDCSRDDAVWGWWRCWWWCWWWCWWRGHACQRSWALRQGWERGHDRNRRTRR